MPVNYYRLELRMPPELLVKLDVLRAEVYERTGNKPSRGKLLREIAEMFFEKEEGLLSSEEGVRRDRNTKSS
jgi:hypothetical protein